MHTNVNASQHAQYIYILNKSHHFHISAVFLHTLDIFDLVTTPTKKKSSSAQEFTQGAKQKTSPNLHHHFD